MATVLSRFVGGTPAYHGRMPARIGLNEYYQAADPGMWSEEMIEFDGGMKDFVESECCVNAGLRWQHHWHRDRQMICTQKCKRFVAQELGCTLGHNKRLIAGTL